MRTYQSDLAEAIQTGETKPEMERRLRNKLWKRFERALRSGYYHCRDCEAPCEREEGEQGQPAHCQRCGSARITWNPPVIIEDRQFIEPEDLG